MINWIVCLLTILVTLLTKSELRHKPVGTEIEDLLLDFNLFPTFPSINMNSNSLIKVVEKKTNRRISFPLMLSLN